MYTDPVEAEYFLKRLQTSLDMAENASDEGAVRAHRGLAECYRAKIVSLCRVEARQPRAVLSLGAFRGKRQTQGLSFARPPEFAGTAAATL
jgi:hypothetical protein